MLPRHCNNRTSRRSPGTVAEEINREGTAVARIIQNGVSVDQEEDHTIANIAATNNDNNNNNNANWMNVRSISRPTLVHAYWENLLSLRQPERAHTLPTFFTGRRTHVVSPQDQDGNADMQVGVTLKSLLQTFDGDETSN